MSKIVAGSSSVYVYSRHYTCAAIRVVHNDSLIAAALVVAMLNITAIQQRYE
jgi:hypothetical protein